DGTPRGPVPQGFVEERVRSGAWPSTISVAVVGTSNWRPFIVPAAPAPEIDQQATVAFNTLNPPAAATPSARPAAAAAPEMRMSAATPAAAPAGPVAAGDMLPEGGIVHAGFWRRFAAYTLDSIILTIPFLLVFGLLAY